MTPPKQCAVNHRYAWSPGADRRVARALPVPPGLHTLALIAALNLTISFGVCAQVNRPPDPVRFEEFLPSLDLPYLKQIIRYPVLEYRVD